MADERVNRLVEGVAKRLEDLSPAPSERCIFQVPNQLRSINKHAYEPEIIAIGPYHHGKAHLCAMEEHKVRYLQTFLQRRSDKNDLQTYVRAIADMEEAARRCYADPVNMSSDKFVEMLLFDGCFIIELIRKCTSERRVDHDEHDLISKNKMILYTTCRDMLLLENQVPFSVLHQLFCMTSSSNQEDLIKMIFQFFDVLPGQGTMPEGHHHREIKHILGLIHDNWLPSRRGIEAYRNMRTRDTISFIRCATELQEAGVKFKKIKGCTLFDIKFENGMIKIPTLRIEDQTESIFRNLIAYEQLCGNGCPDHVTDYMKFMDCLINSAKDVRLLRRHGIIENWLGDDEVVASLFNKLGDNVVHGDKYYYSEVFDMVNSHCSRKWNVWMANLRRDYFQSPWALLSFLAALMLLVLTFVQALYSALSFYKNKY